MADGHGRNWLLWLVPPVPYGRWLTAVAIATALPVIYWALGMFDPAASDRISPLGLMFFAAILAYIIPVHHYINERTLKAFAELEPFLDASAEELQEWKHRIDHKTPRWHLEILGWSTLAWVAHASMIYGSPLEMVRAAFTSVLGATMVISTALVWVTMTSAIFALVHNARLFNRLAGHVPIDLLHIQRLTPFGRVAVLSTLALIGAQAAFPLLWLDGDADPASTLPGIIATAVPMVFLFALPVLPVHRAIATAKAAELTRLAHLIDQFGTTPPETADGFARLNPLLAYRREINETPEWPFNTSIMTRLGLYLVIPPLTWVGAALIENLVDAFL